MSLQGKYQQTHTYMN